MRELVSFCGDGLGKRGFTASRVVYVVVSAFSSTWQSGVPITLSMSSPAPRASKVVLITGCSEGGIGFHLFVVLSFHHVRL
jgi:hypothetical protein